MRKINSGKSVLCGNLEEWDAIAFSRISPLGGDCHYPHHRAAGTYTGLGKQTLGEHTQKNLCAPGPRRKEQ